jgi:hypothetical protein
MKKRLCKKLHKGEFQQHGISIMVPVNVESVESVLNVIIGIADQNKILFCGGGLGRFILPSEEYEELEIPSKIESLIMNIALDPETLSDCIVGYFINPKEKEITVDVADKVKEELLRILKVDFKINCRISLWN